MNVHYVNHLLLAVLGSLKRSFQKEEQKQQKEQQDK